MESSFPDNISVQFKKQLTFYYDPNININYQEIGKGPETVILLHGFGLSLYSWGDIINKFPPERYRLLLIDLKGNGFSYLNPESDYSLFEQANIVIQFLKYMKLRDVIIIGHSYGGLVGIYVKYLIDKDNLGIPLKKMILIDTPAFPEAMPRIIKMLRQPVLSYFGMKLTTSEWKAKQIIRKTFYDRELGIISHLDRYKFFFGLNGYNDSMRELAKQSIPENYESVIKAYAGFNIPILIIWGKQDTFIPLDFGKRLNDQFPNSTLLEIDECGHVPHEEKPDITYDLISDFLTDSNGSPNH